MKPIVADTPDQVRETVQSLAFEHLVKFSELPRLSRHDADYSMGFVWGRERDRLRSIEV